MSSHWQFLADAIPDCRVTHDVADSVIVDWDSLMCLARQRPRDGHWIVVVHDLIDGDMDTAPELYSYVADKSDIPDAMRAHVSQLLEMRGDRQG